MELIQNHRSKLFNQSVRFGLKKYFLAYINLHARVFESINRQMTPYGDNCLPQLSHTRRSTGLGTNVETQTRSSTSQEAESPFSQNRYSVVYLIGEQYHHVGCSTHSQAEAILNQLLSDTERTPVGIYDDKTELFAWEPTRQQDFNQYSIGEQGKQGEAIISITQALRRRDTHWQSGEFGKPDFFA
ncbi:hypothetical protein [Telluribacter sp.]|jgi:hypothetical protein|uniref:hypothetical protein n=1 Tax=Telluribacter sp. TaxID=1978767 RepID=UPI002E159555|nr:hypothetical protein [Telluribacter sp.]